MAIPAPATAARRLAGLVVERFALVPPVDVERLVRERALLVRADWPMESVDAVMTRLGRDRPVIYYRSTDNLARERFTLGHELGHILLPWHLPEQNCAVGTGVLDLPKYSPEDEADVFASCLLLPDSWLLDLVHNHEMTDVLRTLNEAEVTTYAALLALRRVLLSGWVFAFYGGDQVVATPGTHVGGVDVYQGSISMTEIEDSSHDAGVAHLNGHPVRWFRLSRAHELPARNPNDSRTLHNVLQDAVALVESDEAERVRLTQVCNGTVGGALRDAAGRPAIDAYESLVHRFERSEVSRLLEEPDFRVWLAGKVQDIESGNTKRRRRSAR